MLDRNEWQYRATTNISWPWFCPKRPSEITELLSGHKLRMTNFCKKKIQVKSSQNIIRIEMSGNLVRLRPIHPDLDFWLKWARGKKELRFYPVEGRTRFGDGTKISAAEPKVRRRSKKFGGGTKFFQVKCSWNVKRINMIRNIRRLRPIFPSGGGCRKELKFPFVRVFRRS